MARLRQLFPQNYGSSTNINAELENVIRYLNAAELGNFTVAELLARLFDSTGKFIGPIQFRTDSEDGIEYRIGTYPSEEDGWNSLIDLEDLRGAPGTSVGEIGLPLLSNRQDYIPANAETTIDYAFTALDSIIVFKNGLLLRSTNDYTTNPTGGANASGRITFAVPFNGTDRVAVFKVRADIETGYARTDHVAAETQSIFAFPHTPNSRLFVFRNGILLREGAGNDYTASPDTDTVTLLTPASPGTVVSILTVEHPSLTKVTGLMLEEAFLDAASGLIRWDRISVPDAAIPQAKVSGLVALASQAAKITASPSTPVGPAVKDLWLDTSASPAELKFYDGSQWLQTSPPSTLPTFSGATALRFLRVNGTGTGLEWVNIDFSGVIPVAQKGAASGVATLDSSARLPATQLPESISRASYHRVIAGAVPDATHYISRIFNQRITIDSVSIRLGGGTANARLAVNGVPFGSTFAISTTPTDIKLGQGGNVDLPQTVDALTASRTIDVVISAGSGATGLDITVGASIIP